MAEKHPDARATHGYSAPPPATDRLQAPERGEEGRARSAELYEDAYYERMGEFEHARAGFRDFGVPTYGQGRELRERYTDRDFPNRDDRYAGRSGSSYHPEDLADESSASTGFPKHPR